MNLYSFILARRWILVPLCFTVELFLFSQGNWGRGLCWPFPTINVEEAHFIRLEPGKTAKHGSGRSRIIRQADKPGFFSLSTKMMQKALFPIVVSLLILGGFSNKSVQYEELGGCHAENASSSFSAAELILRSQPTADDAISGWQKLLFLLISADLSRIDSSPLLSIRQPGWRYFIPIELKVNFIPGSFKPYTTSYLEFLCTYLS